MVEKIYEVNIGKIYVLAKNEEEARVGACLYVGGDMGTEYLECKVTDRDPNDDDMEYDYIA